MAHWMCIELNRVKTSVSVCHINLFHVGSVIWQPAFEAEEFVYHLLHPSFARMPCNSTNGHRPAHIPSYANGFVFAHPWSDCMFQKTSILAFCFKLD